MRIAPDLAWAAFTGIVCAAIVTLCASVGVATGANWNTEPGFSVSVEGTASDVVRAVARHTNINTWAPQGLATSVFRISGTASGYLIRADDGRSFGASRIGRASAVQSVLDAANERHRLFWSGETSTIALTPSIVASVSHRGGATSVLWHESDWTFEATDLNAKGYSLAREVQTFVTSHHWPRGPGYVVVERTPERVADSWSQWADGEAVIGASDLRSAFGAVDMTSAMRVFGNGQGGAGDGSGSPALQDVLAR